MKGFIKVCGVTSPADAELAADAGASAIGLNLWPRSPRSVDLARAAEIARVVRGRLDIVAVTVDLERSELDRVIEALAPDLVQLHGAGAATLALALAPRVFEAVGLGGEEDVARALASPGPFVLVDARDDVRRGGTGRPPPASLAERVCSARPTVLAGGLGPDNVAAAIAAFAPAGVDAASRLESEPGKKDAGAVRAYVEAARAAFARA